MIATFLTENFATHWSCPTCANIPRNEWSSLKKKNHNQMQVLIRLHLQFVAIDRWSHAARPRMFNFTNGALQHATYELTRHVLIVHYCHRPPAARKRYQCIWTRLSNSTGNKSIRVVGAWEMEDLVLSRSIRQSKSDKDFRFIAIFL